MTRHPADENRFTVACPMPRDAPVSNMIRFWGGAVLVPEAGCARVRIDGSMVCGLVQTVQHVAAKPLQFKDSVAAGSRCRRLRP